MRHARVPVRVCEYFLGEPPSLLDEESCDALRELRELEGLHNVKASVDGLLRLAESNAARDRSAATTSIRRAQLEPSIRERAGASVAFADQRHCLLGLHERRGRDAIELKRLEVLPLVDAIAGWLRD